jgi:hypothetical protein
MQIVEDFITGDSAITEDGIVPLLWIREVDMGRTAFACFDPEDQQIGGLHPTKAAATAHGFRILKARAGATGGADA